MKRIMQRRLMWDVVFIAILYTLIITAIKPQTPAVFLLVLLSVNLIVLRFRFRPLMRLLFIDIIAFFAVSLFWSPAFLLAMPAVYLLCREGQWRWVIPVPLLIVVATPFDPWPYALFVLAGALGSLVHTWQEEKARLLRSIDMEKKKRFEMQRERAELLSSQSEISRIATYSERDRIAQKLHDDLGHEITAGLLSLKAYMRQLEKGEADETVLTAAKDRIENAATELKNTVHNTKPMSRYGLDAFEQAIERFPSNITYDNEGDIGQIGPFHWQVLNAVLKESLTNALKHAGDSAVRVTLEATKQIVRLSVENDAPAPPENQGRGYGLAFMRSRIEAFGGALSIQRGMTFKLIAILPIKEETHEHTAG